MNICLPPDDTTLHYRHSGLIRQPQCVFVCVSGIQMCLGLVAALRCNTHAAVLPPELGITKQLGSTDVCDSHRPQSSARRAVRLTPDTRILINKLITT